MGTAIKIFSVIGRSVELIAAVICAGILGRFVYILDIARVSDIRKIEYALAVSGIAIFFSLILLPPFPYQFWAFPFDLCMFVMWMVSFGLLDNVGVATSPKF